MLFRSVLVVIVVTRRPNAQIASGSASPATSTTGQFDQGNQFTATPATTTTASPTTDYPTDTTTDIPTTEPTTMPPLNDEITQAVTGPYDMRLLVPAGWAPKGGTSPTVTEMDNPAVPGQYVRFGAAPPVVPGTLMDAVLHYEQTTPTIQTDYERVQMTSVSFGDAPEAVEWEFTFAGSLGTRHAIGLYWRINDIEYVLYASSYEPDWSSTQQIFQAVAATVTSP